LRPAVDAGECQIDALLASLSLVGFGIPILSVATCIVEASPRGLDLLRRRNAIVEREVVNGIDPSQQSSRPSARKRPKDGGTL